MSAPASSPATQQARDYLTVVERDLDDLPAEERTALVEDLAQHLEALTTEDDDRPIAVRLGDPVAYAADLRAAAGLPARSAPARAAAPGLRSRLDAVLDSAAYRHAAAGARGAGRLLGDLRPAWWVLRGYLVVLVPCLLGSDYVQDLPVPAPLRSHLLGVLLVLAAVTASVLLGRRKLPRAAGVAVAAAGVLLVLASVAVGKSVWDDVRQDYAYAASPAFMPPPEQATGRYPLVSRYGPVTDVFPYAADGTPLEDVLLYDQDGRPLHVGFQEWWADNCGRVLDPPQAADGGPVPNSFPQPYVLDPVLTPDAVALDGTVQPIERCTADLPRPAVPLPTFPAEPTAPVPGG